MSESNQKKHPQAEQVIISPGPCPLDSSTGLPTCPPPREIDVIKVQKVFAECMNTSVIEAVMIYKGVNGNIDNLIPKCNGVTIISQQCSVTNTGLIKLTIVFKVKSSLNSLEKEKEIVVEKKFKMARAGEKGLTVNCYIYPECLQCSITNVEQMPVCSSIAIDDDDVKGTPPHYPKVTVTCCIGLMILLKLEAEVQLLVPTYGYAPQPPECDEIIATCPAVYLPVWPPYPPQNRLPFNPGTSGGCQNCL